MNTPPTAALTEIRLLIGAAQRRRRLRRIGGIAAATLALIIASATAIGLKRAYDRPAPPPNLAERSHG